MVMLHPQIVYYQVRTVDVLFAALRPPFYLKCQHNGLADGAAVDIATTGTIRNKHSGGLQYSLAFKKLKPSDHSGVFYATLITYTLLLFPHCLLKPSARLLTVKQAKLLFFYLLTQPRPFSLLYFISPAWMPLKWNSKIKATRYYSFISHWKRTTSRNDTGEVTGEKLLELPKRSQKCKSTQVCRLKAEAR